MVTLKDEASTAELSEPVDEDKGIHEKAVQAPEGVLGHRHAGR